MAYTISLSTRFKKQYKKCMRQGLPEAEFLKVINMLAETGSLPDLYRPHQLTGNYKNCMEAHIQPDWLLIWRQNDTELTLLLVATGSHSELFDKNRK